MQRKATPADESFLFELFAEEMAAKLAASGWSRQQMQPLIEVQYRSRAMTYEAQFPNAENAILLAENGSAAGRLLVDRAAKNWRIVDMAVLADCRNKGLGSAALMECKLQAGRANATLELQVAPENPARRLYERMGFVARSADATAVEMIWRSDEDTSAV